jgi:Ferritin-like domain
MQGDATIIQHLNAVLRSEMAAVNQYFLHARMLDHWGAVKLGAREYEESIDEMKHSVERTAARSRRDLRAVRRAIRPDPKSGRGVRPFAGCVRHPMSMLIELREAASLPKHVLEQLCP